MRTSPNRLHWRRGFTILELMMVMFIIIVLVSILIPVIGHVRSAGYVADTQQEMSSISNAIEKYYAAFNAYPGPLEDGNGFYGNSTIAAHTDGTLTPYTINSQFPSSPGPGGFSAGGTSLTNGDRVQFELAGYDSSTNPPLWRYTTANTWQGNVTGSENLVLALLGGLRIDSTTTPLTPVIAFAPDEVGLGPLSLNPNNPQRYLPFITATNLTSLLGEWQTLKDVSSGRTAAQFATLGHSMTGFTPPSSGYYTVEGTPALQAGSDTVIPEFVDRFPIRMPIVYLRTRVGAPGIVSDGTNDLGGHPANIDPNIAASSPMNSSQYQYDIRGLQGYTVGWQNGPFNQRSQKQQGLLGIKSQVTPAPPVYYSFNNPPQIIVSGKPTIPANGGYNAGDYFTNPTIAPTDPLHAGGLGSAAQQQYYNHSGTPRSKDTYILISPGPDGIYGTTDDITSFGAVSP